jgi:peptide/nickel transport system ATP-binding protein
VSGTDAVTDTPSRTRPECDPLLEVSDLRTSFETPRGLVRAVDGVSFRLDAGETLGVVGESGSGKSVLVRTIMHLLPNAARVGDTSRVVYRGRDLTSLPPKELAKVWGADIAMVFQDPLTALNPVRRVGVQITTPMRHHLGLSRAEARDRAVALLAEVGIPDPGQRFDQYPHELSGGMRQRVVIAAALSCEPRLLIADEPTTALDVTVQRQILDLLARLQGEHGMAMILITHDMGVVSGMADRVAVMYAGQFVEVADSAELFTSVRHPYTRALLDSIPAIELPSKTRLGAIEGRPPDMIDVVPGCRFEPRCTHRSSDCADTTPRLAVVAHGTRSVRCFHPLVEDDAVDDIPADATSVVSRRPEAG